MINPFEPKATIRCLVALPRRCRSNAPSQSAALLARILLVSLAMVWPLAAFAQSSSSQPTSSSSQQSSTEPKTQSQAQPATLDPPPKEEDSLAEAARKAKAKKPAAQYWRARSRQILDAIAQTDERIAQKKDEIKKFGSGGFDVTTGMKDNIAYIHDRNAQLKELEKRKADLQKQLDDLQDEGRQAGAPASWFR